MSARWKPTTLRERIAVTLASFDDVESAKLIRSKYQPLADRILAMMADDEFNRGERQALLEVRSFILKHGVKEVDAYCAQRLHDIAIDAKPSRIAANVGIPTE